MRITALIILSLLVAVASVLLADHAMRPKLSDYGIQEGMTLAEVTAASNDHRRVNS